MVVEQTDGMRMKVLSARPVPAGAGGEAEVVSVIDGTLPSEMDGVGVKGNGRPNGGDANGKLNGKSYVQRNESRTENSTEAPTEKGSALLARWASIHSAPADPILHAQTLLRADASPHRLDLSVGAYRDASGAATTLRCVSLAQSQLASEPFSHAYLPLAGDQSFVAQASDLVFGDSVPRAAVAAIQTVSGSGALRLGLGLCQSQLAAATAFLPEPTWPNHHALAPAAGLDVCGYRYYDAGGRSLVVNGMLDDLAEAPGGSVVMLHACGHNPTGADLSLSEWGKVADVVEAKGLVPLFDAAYLGLASGAVADDAKPIRLFAARGIPTLVALSFSKSLGLYNSRVGALLVALPGASADVVGAARSQMVAAARATYSSPPAQGARVAARVMSDRELRGVWETELKKMAGRMQTMRRRLADELQRRGGDGWGFVADGKQGMFVLLGLSAVEVQRLRERWHVYVAPGGRLNVSGLTEGNVGRVAEAVVDVCRDAVSGKGETQ